MSMSQDSQDFEQLRRLIALKRYEQPPPGYFHHFSREVIVRIKAGETGETVTASWWSWEGSWLQRAWAAIETRPALAGAFGVAVCGFFTAGALLSDSTESNAAAMANVVPAVGSLARNNSAAQPGAPAWAQPVNAMLIASNSASAQISQPSLFDEIQRFQRAPQAFMNVNYVPGN